VGKGSLAACPQCDYDIEMMAHILQCLDPMAQVIGDQNIKDLRTLVKDLDMDPNTIEDLSKGFNA